MTAQTLQAPTADQASRQFHAFDGEGRFLIVEWDITLLDNGTSVDRQTAWDRARAQDKPVTFIGLDGEERDLGIVAPKPAPFVVTDGWFLLNGSVIKVQHNRAHTHFYAKRLVVTEEDDHKHGSWVYEPGLVKRMNGAVPMTFEAAREFGELYGVCFKCGAELTAEDSIDRKMGPVCAAKMGWL
jgi:hypothetical protein